MNNQIVSSRSLRQEEIDGYNRVNFIEEILAELQTGRTIKFLAIKKSEYILCVFKRLVTGTWDFSIGDKCFFTYKLSHVVDALEQLYDGSGIHPLKGEFRVCAIHQKANADAEANIEMTPVI